MPVRIKSIDYLTIGEVSQLIDRSPQTIKRWEEQNKIPPSARQKSNNWRIYSPSVVEAIKNYSNSFNNPAIQADLLKS